MIHLLSSLAKRFDNARHAFAQADTHLLGDPSERLHQQVNPLSQTISQLDTHPTKDSLKSTETDDGITKESTHGTKDRHEPSAHSHQTLAHRDDHTHNSRRQTVSHVDNRVPHLVDKAAESLKTCSTDSRQDHGLEIGKSLSHRLNGLAKLCHHRFDRVGVASLHVARTEPCACKVALGSCCLLHDALGDSLTHWQSCRLQTVSIEKNLVLPHDLIFTSESRLQILADLGRVNVVLAGDVAHSGFELFGNVDGFSGLSAKPFHGHGRSGDRLQNIFHLALPAVLQLACKLDSIGCSVAHQDTCLAEGLV